VPPPRIRRLRDLTRYRTVVTQERTREAQRLEKTLEDAGIKLSVVASNILGASCRDIVTALIAGVRDPRQLADLSRTRMRRKMPALVEALTGHFDEHHAFVCRLILERIDATEAIIAKLTA
jgi:transposase